LWLEEIDLIFLKKCSLHDSHAAKILSHQGVDSAFAVATLEEGSGTEVGLTIDHGEEKRSCYREQQTSSDGDISKEDCNGRKI